MDQQEYDEGAKNIAKPQLSDMSCRDAAHYYASRGWSVLPIQAGDKKPLGKWKVQQNRIASKEEIDVWFKTWPDAGVGIVTGSVSKLIVIDIDPRNGGNESLKSLDLPPTYVVQTGGGGQHMYYRWMHAASLQKCTGYLPGVDIQAEGSLIVAPPTVHKSGIAYVAATTIDEMADAPAWLLELKETPKEKLWESGIGGVAEGKRNETAASVCGKFLSEINDKSLWEVAGWGGLKEWNTKNEKPLPEAELRSVFESVSKLAETTSKSEEKDTIAKLMVELVLKEKPTLVHDSLDAPFIHIAFDKHHELHPVHSSRFKQWITRRYWEVTKKPSKSENVKQALDLIGSLACFGGEKVQLSIRVAKHGDAFLYDLCDDGWRAIKITGSGWEMVETPPVVFRRYKHQTAQVLPERGGNLTSLIDFVNITDKQQRLLLQVYLVSCFVPGIAHPVPILYGSQGSAKSTFLRVVRRIIDPSSIELLSFPTKPEQIVQQLSHHWAPFYDNVTSIPDWLSDTLCRAVTGEGFSKRELYTNDEDFIYAFRCCIALNGINIAAQKADLLDRSILFGLERIPPEKRRDEQAFWSRFEQERPLILGAVFDTLSKAMTIYPTVKLERLSRMADFVLWGCAIAKALGYRQEDFLEAYEANNIRQNEEAINEDPVAAAIYALMQSQDEWSGTATELLDRLDQVAVAERINLKQRNWPKAAHILARKITVVQTNLAVAGITIVTGSKGKKRFVDIRHARNTVSAVEALSGDGTDAADSISSGEEFL